MSEQVTDENIAELSNKYINLSIKIALIKDNNTRAKKLKPLLSNITKLINKYAAGDNDNFYYNFLNSASDFIRSGDAVVATEMFSDINKQAKDNIKIEA